MIAVPIFDPSEKNSSFPREFLFHHPATANLKGARSRILRKNCVVKCERRELIFLRKFVRGQSSIERKVVEKKNYQWKNSSKKTWERKLVKNSVTKFLESEGKKNEQDLEVWKRWAGQKAWEWRQFEWENFGEIIAKKITFPPKKNGRKLLGRQSQRWGRTILLIIYDWQLNFGLFTF